MIEHVGFLASWFVWRDAMIVAVIAAAALSFLGVWVVLRRVVYVPLALSQVSSLGVMVAFLLTDLTVTEAAGHQHGIEFDPVWVSMLFAGLAGFRFARARDAGGTATVVAYLVASAGALLLGGLIRRDMHDVSSVLFGNAVLVETSQVFWVAGAATAVGLVHLLFYRCFLFAGFDRESADAFGLPTARFEILLYLSVALMISVATRALGALPSFAFTVFPALAGLAVARSMRGAFAVAVGVGVVSAALGYYLSFVFELPTGGSMAAVSALLYLGAAVLGRRSLGGRPS